jgi:hypothetical protein
MANDESRLITLAARYLRDRPLEHGLLLDLSRVLHIEEPVFKRSLVRWLAGEGGPLEKPQSGGGPGIQIFQLPRDRIVLIIPDALLPARRTRLGRVAQVLGEKHAGSIGARWFNLAREPDAFHNAVQELAAEAGRSLFPAAPPDSEQLEQFMTLERALHAVDISSLLREQFIYRMEPNGRLVPIMAERTIALEVLDRLFSTSLRQSPWLFDKVTDVLDGRMLYHLLRDQQAHSLPIAVKLHAATVTSDEFRGIIARFPARLHGQLVVELPFLEWEAARRTVNEALQTAKREDIAIALDHVPADPPQDRAMPPVDWYRIPWHDGQGHFINVVDAMGWLTGIDPARCILTRCTRTEAVTAGRQAGISHFQGAAVQRMARQQEDARRRARHRREEAES